MTPFKNIIKMLIGVSLIIFILWYRIIREHVYERITHNLNLAPIVELPALYLVAHFNYPRVFVIIFIFKHYSERRLNHYNLFFDLKQNDDSTQIALKPPEELPKYISNIRLIIYVFFLLGWSYILLLSLQSVVL